MIAPAFNEFPARLAIALVMDVERHNAGRLLRLPESYNPDDDDMWKLFTKLRDFEEDHIERLASQASSGEGSMNG